MRQPFKFPVKNNFASVKSIKILHGSSLRFYCTLFFLKCASNRLQSSCRMSHIPWNTSHWILYLSAEEKKQKVEYWKIYLLLKRSHRNTWLNQLYNRLCKPRHMGKNREIITSRSIRTRCFGSKDSDNRSSKVLYTNCCHWNYSIVYHVYKKMME